jgi:methylenetetrahydrofolate--tRNA-(uracil-5-)-methyltransferase
MACGRMTKFVVVGGGLAGTEAAWQAAERGISVLLYEMRPGMQTGAHSGAGLAELVCSNSLGSDLIDRAAGLLKAELRRLGSMVLACAERTAVPAGGALAVDREAFSELVTKRIKCHPNIRLVREEIRAIPAEPAVIASGPLTSLSLSQAIANLMGQEHLYFFDALAPIVELDSIDMAVAFRGSRYGRGEKEAGDYVNCPLDREQYQAFVEALASAERIPLKEFERELESGVRAGAKQFFEGCLPVEILAQRSPMALAYGPLRPVGLSDPHSGRRPYANVQLRQDNLAGTLYNLVGFQTNLIVPEQQRVFRLIPGLGEAAFVRYGQMHRNTFIYSPAHLLPTMQFRGRDDLFFAGQITGVEGYAGNIATGLLAGWNAARVLSGEAPLKLPEKTMIGALCHYITQANPVDFQPMKANYGLLPPLEDDQKRGKRERAALFSGRAQAALDEFLGSI